MWKWDCPILPGKTFWNHSSKNARKLIGEHALIDQCRLIHELMDDGFPCTRHGCETIYIPARPTERKE